MRKYIFDQEQSSAMANATYRRTHRPQQSVIRHRVLRIMYLSTPQQIPWCLLPKLFLEISRASLKLQQTTHDNKKGKSVTKKVKSFFMSLFNSVVHIFLGYIYENSLILIFTISIYLSSFS